jgi:hypothetical protein
VSANASVKSRAAYQGMKLAAPLPRGRIAGVRQLWRTVLAGACFVYRPVTLAPEPGSQVRVIFITALSVITYAGSQGSVRRVHPGVLEASGAIQAVAGDTIALRLGELRTAAGAIPNISDQVALLPSARIGHIEQRRFQAATSLLVSLGALPVATTTLVVLLIADVVHAF